MLMNNFTHFGTKNRICEVKAKLIEYKYENKLVFKYKYALAPVYFIAGEIGFIHHGRMTSYNL